MLFLVVAVAPANAMTTVFTSEDAEKTFKVPPGVTSLEIFAVGGRGGDTPFLVPGATQGGDGAEVTGVISVTPDQILYVEVGGNGNDSDVGGGVGGFNGGGNGGGNGQASGGGGASDVRTSPRSAGLAPDTRLIVAAGGGGAGGLGGTNPGEGGDAGSPGFAEEGEISQGGGAGTQEEGGAGGEGFIEDGEDGVLGIGGAGGATEAGGPGGGGGGGFFGGGGGGGAGVNGGGGGGGGSSLVPAGGEVEIASCCIEPQVQITVAPMISIATPADGASLVQGQVVNASYSCAVPEGATVSSCAGPVANGAPIDTSTVGSHSFTVNAEDTEGGTSSKSVSYTVLAPAPTPPSNPSPPTPSAPDTLLGSHPAKKIKTTKKKVKVKFTFSSSPAGATFKCKLDKAAFSPCASPKNYKLKPGKHKFSVVASKDGLADPTPASFKFTVVKDG